MASVNLRKVLILQDYYIYDIHIKKTEAIKLSKIIKNFNIKIIVVESYKKNRLKNL